MGSVVRGEDGVVVSEEARREPPARVTLTELLQAAEAERARIADELHDDAVQALTACLLHLSLVEDRMGQVRTMGAYRSARDNLERGLRAARALLTDLRAPTLDTHGAAAALNQRLQRLTQGGEVARLDWRVPERLDPHAETLLFRAVQQALPTPSPRAPLPLATLSVTAAPQAGGVTAEVTWTLTTEGPPPPQPEPAPAPAPAAQPLAYQLIHLAGGTVHAEQAPRDGGRVRIWLPLELPGTPVW